MATDRDAELLRSWRGGDARAAAVLFHRHSPVVRAFARREGVVDPDDLVQLTFLACLEGAHRFREDSSVRTFLLGIARNQIHALRRRTRKDFCVPLSSHDSPEDSASLQQTMLTERQCVILTHALLQMPIELRTVLELRYWQGHAQGDIAARLGIPLGTVASRIRRGQEMLRAFVMSPD